MTRFLFAIPLLWVPLAAQNSDFSLLVGLSASRSQVRPGLILGESRGSVQFNYAWQFHEGPKGRLYGDLPVFIVGGSSGTISSTQGIIGRAGGAIFLTPGIRYHYNLSPRVAVYGAAGLGFASKRENVGVFSGSNVISTSGWNIGPAADVGGGLDFRLSRRWSLRAEVRDFITNKATAISSRNYVLAQFGFALHF